MFLPLEPGESPFPVHPQTRGLEGRLIKQEITEIAKKVFAGAGLGSDLCELLFKNLSLGSPVIDSG